MRASALFLSLGAILPMLSHAEGVLPQRSPGNWKTISSMGQLRWISSQCTDDAAGKTAPIFIAKPAGAKDCSASIEPVAEGYRMELTCTTFDKPITSVAMVKGDFSSAYVVDVVTYVDGKVVPDTTFHTEAKRTGVCARGAQPGQGSSSMQVTK
jgi:hypothetical protein